MKRAGRYAVAVYSQKPVGLPLSQYPILGLPASFPAAVFADIPALFYAALVTFGEALRNIAERRSTWSVTKLYYTCFYAIRVNLNLDNMVVFNSGKEEFLCDIASGLTQPFGRSSHNFLWSKFGRVSRLNSWIYSEDSRSAYESMRKAREDANYNNDFMDPSFINLFDFVNRNGLERSYRAYKEDAAFFYTYLNDHFVVAYPARLMSYTAVRIKQAGIVIDEVKLAHLARLYPFRDAGLW
jgi:hypothetical protein